MAKMMSPNTTIYYYPDNGFADPSKPTLAELNAGINLSCAIATGYTLNFTDSDTDDSKTICDEANVQNRGFSNYEASLTFYRAPIGATDLESQTFEVAYDLFKGNKRELGWLVSRQGYKSDVSFAANQPFSIFKVMNDYGQDVSGEGGAPIQFTVPFLQQGQAWPNLVATA